MADLITFDVDDEAVLFAIGTVVDQIDRRVKVAARQTSDRIADEARGRVARRTGATAAGITVEETHDGTGYVVFVAVTGDRWQGLPSGLEFGTRYMSARPFLHASARLEESGHEQRVIEAINQALTETGLGE